MGIMVTSQEDHDLALSISDDTWKILIDVVKRWQKKHTEKDTIQGYQKVIDGFMELKSYAKDAINGQG